MRAVHFDPRLFLAKFLANEFVRRGNAHHVFHLRHGLDRFHACCHIAHAHHADDHALLSFDGVHLVAEVLHLFSNLVNFFPRRMQFHGNNHFSDLSKQFPH